MPKFGHQFVNNFMEERRLEQRLEELKDRKNSLWEAIEDERFSYEEVADELEELKREIADIEEQLG